MCQKALAAVRPTGSPVLGPSCSHRASAGTPKGAPRVLLLHPPSSQSGFIEKVLIHGSLLSLITLNRIPGRLSFLKVQPCQSWTPQMLLQCLLLSFIGTEEKDV